MLMRTRMAAAATVAALAVGALVIQAPLAGW